jgi:CRISPR-associated protein Cmr5
MGSNRVNIEKKRMEIAFLETENIKNQKTAKEFESYVNKVPAFIHTNGVGNTFAYLAGQKKTWTKVVDAIFKWLNNESSGFSSKLTKAQGNTNAEKLLDFVIELTENEIRALTIELLAYLNWLRKFAKANKIKLENNSKSNDNG